MAQGLFLEAQGRQARISHHEVAADEDHLHDELPVDVLLAPAALLRRGVQIRSSPETTRAALRTFRAAWDAGLIPGAWRIHLEGPWISSEDGFRGVHRLEYVRDPSIADLEALRKEAGQAPAPHP